MLPVLLCSSSASESWHENIETPSLFGSNHLSKLIGRDARRENLALTTRQPTVRIDLAGPGRHIASWEPCSLPVALLGVSMSAGASPSSPQRDFRCRGRIVTCSGTATWTIDAKTPCSGATHRKHLEVSSLIRFSRSHPSVSGHFGILRSLRAILRPVA